jgi:hypothetical protein
VWLLLSDGLLGNLDAGAFLTLRRSGESGAELEIVHANLRNSADAQELVLLRGDVQTCGDAFELLAEDLEAEDLLIGLLDTGSADELEAPPAPGTWVELDERTLFNLESGAALTVAAIAGSFAVVYGAGQGSLTLMSGSADEADAYLNGLATILGASSALVEAESDSEMRRGPFGALLSRMKKGEA